MNSDTKNSHLVQVETQKSYTSRKEEKIFTFVLFFCLHQISKNKKVTGNIIYHSSEVILLCRRTVWVISLSTLTLTEHEDKIKNKLIKFLKPNWQSFWKYVINKQKYILRI